MADAATIAREVKNELGLRDPRDIASIDRLIAEATLDILTQRNGRFLELKRTEIITILVSTAQYEMPDDFNTPYLLSEIDDNQIPIKKWALPNVFEVLERKELSKNLGRIAYFDNYYNGNSFTNRFVLIFIGGVTDGALFRLDYFRKPQETDTALIQNERIVKKYVASHFPEVNRMADRDLVMYERLKKTYSDRAMALVRDFVVKPSKKTQRLNRFLDVIGRGLQVRNWDR